MSAGIRKLAERVAKAAAGVALAALGFAAQAQEATYVGEAKCLSCHNTENDHFGDTQHARAFRGNPKNEREKRVCETCHGPGSKHVAKTGDPALIIKFTRDSGTPIETKNAQCLSCHGGGQRQHWPGSTHAQNLVACSDCHAPMERRSKNGLLRRPRSPRPASPATSSSAPSSSAARTCPCSRAR